MVRPRLKTAIGEPKPMTDTPRTATEAVNRMTPAHGVKIEAAVPAEVVGSFSTKTAREAVNQLSPKHRSQVEQSMPTPAEAPDRTV
jgi:hypothetical protein